MFFKKSRMSYKQEQPLTRMEMSITEEKEREKEIENYNFSVAYKSKVDESKVIKGIQEINRKLDSDSILGRELVNRGLQPLYYAVVVGKDSQLRNKREYSKAELKQIAEHFTEKGFKVRIVPEDGWRHEHVEVFVAWAD